MSVEVIEGDCLEVMRGMADASVDAVVTDPPYYRVVEQDWDRQWKTPGEYLDWCATITAALHRVLKPSGTLYWFSGWRLAADIEMMLRDRFLVHSRIIWAKPYGSFRRHCPEWLRTHAPSYEVVFLCEPHHVDSPEKCAEREYRLACDRKHGEVMRPLWEWLAGELKAAGLEPWDVEEAIRVRGMGTGAMARHWFGPSQFCMPTRRFYELLQDLAKRESFRREYESFRREYKELRREYEELRRPFYIEHAPEIKNDVWTFAPVQGGKGKHPCEKPIDMMRGIVRTCTRPGGLVLDPFGGSGSTGAAAVLEGRAATLIERDPLWVENARDRIAAAKREREGVIHHGGAETLRVRVRARPPAVSSGGGQCDLFEAVS